MKIGTEVEDEEKQRENAELDGWLNQLCGLISAVMPLGKSFLQHFDDPVCGTIFCQQIKGT